MAKCAFGCRTGFAGGVSIGGRLPDGPDIRQYEHSRRRGARVHPCVRRPSMLGARWHSTPATRVPYE